MAQKVVYMLIFLKNVQSEPLKLSTTSPTILKMKGNCGCLSPSGEIVNLTSIGLKDGYPRFPDFSFPEKQNYHYFYNPCFPFTWPPEHLTETISKESKQKRKNFAGQSWTKWLDKWKEFVPGGKRRPFSGLCKNSAICRGNNDNEYETLARQNGGSFYCQQNKTINKIQFVYKGVKGSVFENAGMVVTLVCDPGLDIPELRPVYDEGRKCDFLNCWEGWKYVNLHHRCCCPGICAGANFVPFSKETNGLSNINKVVFVLAVILVGMIISTLMFWFWRHQKLKQEYGRIFWEQRAYGTLTDHVIPYGSIKLVEAVGDGSYGVVYKGLWRSTEVAVKRIREGLLDEDMEAFKREATILCNLRHHNIVQFMGVCLLKPNFCIVTEFMEGGSVADIIHEKRTILPWETRLKWALDAAKGMAFLHSASPPMMHRDLKSDNLLVDENGLVKVADFGTTKILETVLARRWKDCQVLSLKNDAGFTGFHTRLVGTVRWVAPEVIRVLGEELPALYSMSADVYSYGVTVWEMVTNRRPFWELQWDHEVMEAVNGGLRPEIPSFCLPEIRSFIESCWHQNSKERPTFTNILSRLEELSIYKANTEPVVVLPSRQFRPANSVNNSVIYSK